jgi:hypothetical protein
MADELVQVLTTMSGPEAEIARGRLESEGIPVLLRGDNDGPYRLGPVYVYVPASFAARARQFLDELNRRAAR